MNDDLKTKRNIAIKRTGDMLLSGWKMLSFSCPICSSALLSKNEHMRCSFCDLPVMREESPANLKSVNSNSPSIIKSTTDAIESQVNLLDSEKLDDYVLYSESSEPKHCGSLEQAKKEYDLHNKSMVAVSNKIGEKMLSGWTMLSVICPFQSCKGTPIMQSPGLDSQMLCVACDKSFEYNKFGELQPIAQNIASNLDNIKTIHPSSETIIPAVAAVVVVADSADISSKSSFYLDMSNAPVLDASSSTSLSSFSTKLDDSSSKLSKKLLMGWAMLEQCCTNYVGGCSGNVPLMRDLTGQIRCVQCNFFPENTTTASSSSVSSSSQLYPLPLPPVVSSLGNIISNTTPTTSKESHTDNNNNNDNINNNDNNNNNNDNNNTIVNIHTNRVISSTKERVMLNTLHAKLEKAIDDLELTDCIDTSIKLTELIIKLKQAIQLLES